MTKKQLIQRLQATEVYTGKQIRAHTYPVGEPENLSRETPFILVCTETRDAIIAALKGSR